jgi:tRNA (cmo5U34)-methyltransferase
LTLQFTPIEYRLQILKRIYEHSRVLIIVEKILGATADLDAQLVKRYYDLKGGNGYSPEQIERKRLSLEGVLVPVTAKWNEELLRLSGFQQIDCFWRWMNFAGWIAIK